ncbi:MAG: aminodeoxychorismate/anthranilate synthase component II [Armatimonadetes bacterium]|nr:aminodeoxychorismate/anthranilate synthase component II [Armatimonadota bacterium]
MTLVIDNYDSFTYNLVQYIGELGGDPQVYRNDEISVEEALALGPSRILISPGPCTPNEAGISVELIRALESIPLLGVCLGHQCICAAFGGTIVRADRIMHGKSSAIEHDRQGVFDGLPSPFSAIRYHSLLLMPETLPSDLSVTAKTEQGEIMGVRHKRLPIEGVQFHPESIMTEHGKQMIANFLRMRASESA